MLSTREVFYNGGAGGEEHMTRITAICALTIGMALQWAAVTAQARDSTLGTEG